MNESREWLKTIQSIASPGVLVDALLAVLDELDDTESYEYAWELAGMIQYRIDLALGFGPDYE
jgi:hypothetical protein